jgi:hypothetical protein
MSAPQRRLGIGALLVLVCFPGCAMGPASYPGDRPRANGEVKVEVRNDSQDDVEVYVDRDGGRSRLGLVLRSGREEFTLQGMTLPLSGRLRFAVNRLGSSRTFVTEAVQVEGGETVLLNIAPELELTRVEVRR